MTESEPRLVWYASYGSNCSRERFLTYLRGGTIPGTDRRQQGARDPQDPRADGPAHFASDVCFSGRSLAWGGAPAFLEHRAAAGDGALGRRYLITEEQFGDVVAQESGRPIDTTVLPDLRSFGTGERRVIGDGRYDALVALEPIDGVPCISFTSPDAPEDRPPAAPSATYLGTIVRGLREVHSLTPTEIAERLITASGMQPAWESASVVDLMG